MFRIRRIYDDLLPIDRKAIAHLFLGLWEGMHRFAGLPRKSINNMNHGSEKGGNHQPAGSHLSGLSSAF